MEIEDISTTVNERTDVDALLEQISELEKELEEKEDRDLRLRADFDNYRKRMQKELGTMLSQEKERLLISFLDVYEDINEAIMAHPDEGLCMVRDKFAKILQEAGVKEISTVGKPFDHACHHAIATEASSSHQEGIIIKEIRKGYKIDDKVIKPSYVVVCKGETNG